MCDAIEGASANSTSSTNDEHGIGLKKALPNYAKWYTANYLPSCE